MAAVYGPRPPFMHHAPPELQCLMPLAWCAIAAQVFATVAQKMAAAREAHEELAQARLSEVSPPRTASCCLWDAGVGKERHRSRWHVPSFATPLSPTHSSKRAMHGTLLLAPF